MSEGQDRRESVVLREDLLIVEISHEATLSAKEADLYVTVEGSSLFTGTVAFRKAKEVGRLLESLSAAGTSEEDVTLVGVQARVEGRLLNKSSSASYQLCVRCTELARLDKTLAAVTSSKNTTLDRIEWQYPDEGDEGYLWLSESLARANRKAAVIAKGLGVGLGRVHRFEQRHSAVETEPLQDTMPLEGAAVRPRQPSLALGIELTHTRRVSRNIVVQYHVLGGERVG